MLSDLPLRGLSAVSNVLPSVKKPLTMCTPARERVPRIDQKTHNAIPGLLTGVSDMCWSFSRLLVLNWRNVCIFLPNYGYQCV